MGVESGPVVVLDNPSRQGRGQVETHSQGAESGRAETHNLGVEFGQAETHSQGAEAGRAETHSQGAEPGLEVLPTRPGRDSLVDRQLLPVQAVSLAVRPVQEVSLEVRPVQEVSLEVRRGPEASLEALDPLSPAGLHPHRPPNPPCPAT